MSVLQLEGWVYLACWSYTIPVYCYLACWSYTIPVYRYLACWSYTTGIPLPSLLKLYYRNTVTDIFGLRQDQKRSWSALPAGWRYPHTTTTTIMQPVDREISSDLSPVPHHQEIFTDLALPVFYGVEKGNFSKKSLLFFLMRRALEDFITVAIFEFW